VTALVISDLCKASNKMCDPVIATGT